MRTGLFAIVLLVAGCATTADPSGPAVTVREVRDALEEIVLNPQEISTEHGLGDEFLMIRATSDFGGWPMYALMLSSDSAECVEGVCQSHWRAVMYGVRYGHAGRAMDLPLERQVAGWIEGEPRRSAEFWARRLVTTRQIANWSGCTAVDDIFDGLADHLNLDSDIELVLRNLRRGNAPRIVLHSPQIEVVIQTFNDKATISGPLVSHPGIITWAGERAELLETCWEDLE